MIVVKIIKILVIFKIMIIRIYSKKRIYKK